MNIIHLKYAVEVEKTRSINKAAKNLFMGQPNLSRAIKELESSLGITIFKRTSKGIIPTPQGEEFLRRAKRILAQVDEMESMYQGGKDNEQKFSISVPRASYIGCAFTEFIKHIDPELPADIFYKETNSMRVISNILQEDYKLGIIRYHTGFEQYFSNLLHEKGLTTKDIYKYTNLLTMSKHHPISDKNIIEQSDLDKYIEIAHADSFVPSLPFTDAMRSELADLSDKHIFVYERSSQFELLSRLNNTFMWCSPIPTHLLDLHGIIQRSCGLNNKIYKDVLIYRKGYVLTELDNNFISEIDKFSLSL